MKQLLFNTTYRRQAAANVISTLGDAFLNTCMAIYVMKTTGSVLLFASMLTLQNMPQILLGPLAGSWVDRFNKMTVVVVIDLIRGLFFMVLAFVAFQNHLNLNALYAMVLFEATLQSFYASAKTSLLPTLLERHELVKANMLDGSLNQISLIVGPALSVILLGFTNIGVILALNGVSFIAAALLESINLKQHCHRFTPKPTVIKTFHLPFGIYKNKEVLSLTLNGVLTHFAVMPFFIVGLPYLLLQVYHLSNQAYGFINSLAMAGTLLSVFTVPWINKQCNDLKALNMGMYGMLLAGIALLPLSIPAFQRFLSASSWNCFVYFCAILLVFYLSFSTYGVFFGSFYQKKVPTTHLGRFTSMLIAGFAIGRVIGTQIFGWLFSHHFILGATTLLVAGMLAKLLLNFMTPSAEEPLVM